MSSYQDRLDKALDGLDEAARKRLAIWHALRLAELRPLRERSLQVAGPKLIEDLLAAGWLEFRESRSLLPWRRGAMFELTPAGAAQLAYKRDELETLQEQIRSSLEAGWDSIRRAGHDPAEFHFERMLLLHGRFRDRPVGFPERGARLSKVVRDVERDARVHNEDDTLNTAATLGLFSRLD